MRVSIIGQGYVGLTISAFASKHYEVLGFDLNSKMADELYIIMAIYRLITTNLNNIISNTNSNIDTTIEKLKFVEPSPRPDIYTEFMNAGKEGKYAEVLQFQSDQRDDATILFGPELMYSIKV